jgi:hypothetical protein
MVAGAHPGNLQLHELAGDQGRYLCLRLVHEGGQVDHDWTEQDSLKVRKHCGKGFSEEESYIIQPRGEAREEDFLSVVHHLLVRYNQYAAAVRVPSEPMAFLLLQDGEHIPLGTSAETRQPGEPYFTALIKGPRADDGMLDPWEIHGERNPFRRFLNWVRGRTDMNRPRHERGGRRFVIKNPEPIPRGKGDVQEL